MAAAGYVVEFVRRSEEKCVPSETFTPGGGTGRRDALGAHEADMDESAELEHLDGNALLVAGALDAARM